MENNNNKIWIWVFGITFGLLILALLFFGGSNRQAYRIARGAIDARVEQSQERIDAAVEMATAAVDLALEASANLPSQEANADLIKQDIEAIGDRLSEATEARGDAAVEKLDQSIENFNTALQTIEDASKGSTDPQVQFVLGRIYGLLETARDLLVQTILNAQQ